MINGNLAFLFFASIVFIGFILNALFSKLKIANIMPLMLIGVLIGPLLHIIGTGSGSLVSSLSSLITGVAVSFILFDVGLNMNYAELRKVLKNASKYTFGLTFAVGIISSLIGFFVLHFQLLIAFIFGFAIAGPSTVIVPMLTSLVGISEELKTTLRFEAIASDILTLLVPLVLLQIVVSGNVTFGGIASIVVSNLFGSAILAVIFALFWLYILNRFEEQSRSYTWMLTIAMVLATYGGSQQIGFNGAITVFIFGLLISNLGARSKKPLSVHTPTFLQRHFALGDEAEHIKSYQKEIVFFVSTFFFVYLGLLFSVSQVTPVMLVISFGFVAIFALARVAFMPILSDYISKDGKLARREKSFISFNISRGLAPTVIAAVPLTLGIAIPGFVDTIFLVVLFSNLANTIGIFWGYRH